MNAWIIAFIIIITIYIAFKLRRKGARFGAAMNALLAKYTFNKLGANLKNKVIEQSIDILERGHISNDSEWIKGLSERQLYGLYALAMAELGIEPFFEGEKWSYVDNPFVALINADKYINIARDVLNNKFDIDVKLE